MTIPNTTSLAHPFRSLSISLILTLNYPFGIWNMPINLRPRWDDSNVKICLGFNEYLAERALKNRQYLHRWYQLLWEAWALKVDCRRQRDLVAKSPSSMHPSNVTDSCASGATNRVFKELGTAGAEYRHGHGSEKQATRTIVCCRFRFTFLA